MLLCCQHIPLCNEVYQLEYFIHWVLGCFILVFLCVFIFEQCSSTFSFPKCNHAVFLLQIKGLKPCNIKTVYENIFCPPAHLKKKWWTYSFFFLSDQQNFNVSVENMLTRCLDNERSWRLHNSARDNNGPQLLIEDSLPLLHERKADTLVFPCILSALQWITQGRDTVLADPAKSLLPVSSSISAKGAPLREATEIHILITGSLHLVGGVLKHLEPLDSSN